VDADQVRDQQRARWEAAAPGWRRHADRVQQDGMPVSVWMVERLELQPGERVLELAAGPGDTGFLAAEVISPGGTLISSDGSDAMVEVARARATARGIENVEFRQLELEWIDLETASVDAVLCRWGYMFVPDPEAALRETRRVLRPGGRVSLATWEAGSPNPRFTVIGDAFNRIGHPLPAPGAGAPGPFALGSPERLEELLSAAGFLDVVIDVIELTQSYEDLGSLLTESVDMSPALGEAYGGLGPDDQEELERAVGSLVEPWLEEDGSLRLPARSLVAAAGA
jgi:ubiquinone/menaquinone biosynthesis C-methylase UbiE